MMVMSSCSSAAVNTQSLGILKHAQDTELEVLVVLVQSGNASGNAKSCHL